MEVSGQLYAPTTSPPKMNPGTHLRSQVGPQSVWTVSREDETLTPAGIPTMYRQPVASRWANCAVPAP